MVADLMAKVGDTGNMGHIDDIDISRYYWCDSIGFSYTESFDRSTRIMCNKSADFQNLLTRGGRWIVEKTNKKNGITTNRIFDCMVNGLLFSPVAEHVVAIYDTADKIEIWALSPFDTDVYNTMHLHIANIVNRYHATEDMRRMADQAVAVLLIINSYVSKARRLVNYHIKFLVNAQGKVVHEELTPYVRGEKKLTKIQQIRKK